jgi:hypothetical protein
MNKFVKSGSKLLIFVVCLFITPLFIDQANLLDIILGNDKNIDIEHPEEADVSIIQTNPILNKTSFKNTLSSTKNLIHGLNNSHTISKTVIIDEDSPLTEPSIPLLSTLTESFKNEDNSSYAFISIQDNLYLQNRCLLI